MSAGVEVNDGGRAIQGLKLTLAGAEICVRIEGRIRSHEAQAERWRREQARTPEQQTEEEPLLPDHMCEHEAQRHEWRIECLEFIRDHIDAGATYQLAETDLAFAELMPEKPKSIEQEEYEARTSVGFNLERLVKTVGSLGSARYAALNALATEE